MEEKIKTIRARKILNSRGNWTLEVLAKTENFKVKAGVPSGASTGQHEAKVVDIEQAVKNVNEVIAPKLKNQDPTKQKEIDQILIELDGTKDKSNLGANAIVGTSIAICKLGAEIQNLPLWQHIEKISNVKSQISKDNQYEVGSRTGLPKGAFNIINGGKHAWNNLAIQEFMIVPARNASHSVAGGPDKETFSENLESAVEIYHRLKEIIKNKYGKAAINLGDEGGFAPLIFSAIEALNLLKEVIQKDTKIILDCAATQFYKNGEYFLEGGAFTKEGLVNFYEELIKNYPIIGLEDPFAEDDIEGWRLINSKFEILNSKQIPNSKSQIPNNNQIQNSKLLIIGDDLTTTNSERIKMAKEKELCNGVIIKINQIGTVTEAIEAVKLAKSYNWKIIVSHRSGETNDDFIADFAVGVGADFIKAGAPARGERVAKYNRLLEIEEEMKRMTND